MSSDVSVRMCGVSKEYRVYRRPEHRLLQALWRNRRFYDPVAAVVGVSADIRRGETFGIVGRNGSGKSTLLQLICGTTRPTAGSVQVTGRVSALLELGAGFNPEFTGRENVWVSASVLGLSDPEVRDRFDAIEAFAGIGAFIDQPVRNYSSGMFARLAFAVAIHVDADILVVDEALAVGDEAFQRKCFSRIFNFRDEGGTVLFVSHDASSVLEICDRAMLMDAGQALATGSPKDVIESYHRLLFASEEDRGRIREEIQSGAIRARERAGDRIEVPRSTTRAREKQHSAAYFDPDLVPQTTLSYSPRGCEIVDPHLQDPEGRRVNVLTPGEEYLYTYDARFVSDQWSVRFGMLLKLVNGTEICGFSSHPAGHGIERVLAGTVLRVQFRFQARLRSGVYFLNAGLLGAVDGAEEYLHRIVDAVMLRVKGVTGSCLTSYVDLSADPFVSIRERDGTAG